MSRLKCNTCGGVYDDVLPDGCRYFHACPPISLAVVDRGAGPITIPATDVKDGEAVIRTADTPRPNARNENVKAVKDQDGKPVSVPIADGPGASPAPAVVVAPADAIAPG